MGAAGGTPAGTARHLPCSYLFTAVL